MLKDLRELLWVLLLSLTIGGLWYHFYVRDNDQMVSEILACMQGDRSKEMYDVCRQTILEEAQ